MTVTTDEGTWVVPPQRAVWMPAGVEHEIRCTGAVEMRTLYIQTGALPHAPNACRVVTVSPLLRELILRAIELPQPYPLGGAEERLIATLLDEIATAPGAPLHLPVPADETLRVVVDGLLADPADSRTLSEWASAAGVSDRTLARLFVKETGVTFAGWRQQLRLVRALESLAAGRSVTEAALDVGYESPSSFIAMFRRALGTTPSRYFASDS
jgi:AraC-like DNA-binding protein